MQDKENKDIVDSQGNVIKSTKDNKVKQFFETNIWNSFGTVLALGSILGGVIHFIISKSFSVSCSMFYGIDRKYFSGTEMFENKLIFVFWVLVLFAYPFVLSYINEKIKSKVCVIVTFLLTIFILFLQNILYTVYLIDSIPWNWWKGYIPESVKLSYFFTGTA